MGRKNEKSCSAARLELFGRIFSGPEVGRKGHNNKYVLVSCPDCGRERFKGLHSVIEMGKNNCRCLSCSNKRHVNNQGRFKSKEKHHLWKGGRFKTKQGYVYVQVESDSPFISMAKFFSKSFPYIMEHRLIVAKSLGRPISSQEIVHHCNGVKDDNRIENLLLVSNSTHNTRSYIEQLQERIRLLEGTHK